MTGYTTFRRRLLAQEPLIGTFCKFPVPHAIELLGGVGFDFVVIDEEHGPWDRITIDTAILAARAAGIAGLVRVSDPIASRILSVLDDGAAGVLVPHVLSAEKARDMAAACRYRGGKRGFSNTTRAGNFGGLGLWDHVKKHDEEVSFIAMIEDAEALEDLDGILSTPGLDAAFIGRGDLTVALGASGPESPEVISACAQIMAAAKRHGKPVAIMSGGTEDTRRYREMGASAFIVSSDQGFLRNGALKSLSDVRLGAN
ncbi:HpcH/HpaI aldolase family protein [Neotabrizicola sp. VNH66]|uniref:HpcH/HpaI aldolase family protein n=1 Tax=Neotabrizicola sp. VNH66 TaxID=3400918 RepID=UPI003C05518F